jgi:hypothetical protein
MKCCPIEGYRPEDGACLPYFGALRYGRLRTDGSVALAEVYRMSSYVLRGGSSDTIAFKFGRVDLGVSGPFVL